MALSQLVLFHGDEYRCEVALRSRIEEVRALDKAVEQHSLFADEIDPSSLSIELSSASLFAVSRHFVIRRAEKLTQKGFLAVSKQKLPPETYVSFTAANLKSNSSILKQAKKAGDAIALPSFKGKQAIQEARRVISSCKVHLSSEASRFMIDHYNDNLLALHEELRKLETYAHDQSVSEEEVRALVFSYGEKSVYPLLDAIMSKDMRSAMAQLARSHEDPAGTFSALTRQITRVLMVRMLLDSNMNASQIASIISMPSWMVRRFIGQAKSHSSKMLTAALDLAIDLDLQAKNGGIRFRDALLKLMLFIADPIPPAREYDRQSQLFPSVTGSL